MAQQVTLESFALVLSSLTNPNNNVRRDAEYKINCLSPDQQMYFLVNVALSFSADTTLRLTTYVSMKVILIRSEMGSKFSNDTVNLCKSSFIKILMNEPEKSLRKKMIYSVSALLSYLWDGNNAPWPEMAEFCLQLLFSDNVLNRDLSLSIISTSPYLFGSAIEEKVLQMYPKFVECLNLFGTNPELPILTFETISSLVEYCGIQFIEEKFTAIAPVLIDVIARMGVKPSGSELFDCLIDIIEIIYGIFMKDIGSLINTLLHLLKEPACSDYVEKIFELIVSVAEINPKKFTQQASQNIGYIIKCTFHFMSQISDEGLNEWINTIGDDEDEISNDLLHKSTTGEISLDRLARSLDRKLVFDFVIQEIEAHLKTDNWRYHNAAIVAIGAIAEGCKAQIKPILPQIVDRFLPYFQSDNPRIVFSCLNTYGQLAIDFAKHFHTTYHQKVFPHVLAIAKNHNYLKVQTNAVLAFGNIIDGCKRRILRIYSNDIFFILMKTIERVCQNLSINGAKHILSYCLSAVTSLSSSFKENFEYYPNVMTISWSMLNSFASIEYIELYFDVLHCSLSVLEDIGEEKALPYLNELTKRLEVMSELTKNTPLAEEYRLNYIKCLEKVCSIKTDELYPQLARLLLELMSYFQYDLKDPGKLSVSDQLSAEVMGNDAGKFKTDVIEDQSVVCSLLSRLAIDLKPVMVQFLPQIFPVVFQVFQSLKSETIICDLADCIVQLLAVSKISGLENLMNYWLPIKPVFYNHFYALVDEDSIVEYLETIEGLTEVTEQATMDSDLLLRFGHFLKTKLEHVLINIVNSNKDGKVDKNAYKIDEEIYDEFILNSTQSVSHNLFKVYGPAYMQIYGMFINSVLNFLTPEVPNEYQRVALFFLTDILEYAPKEFIQMEQRVLPLIFSDIDTDDMEAAQLGVFTVGLLAQSQRPEYLNYIRYYIPLLYKYATQPHKFDVEFTVKCNAIASIGRCLKYVPSVFTNPVQSLQEWLSLLPVIEDETDFVLEYLCDLIEQNMSLVFLSDGSNANHIILSIIKMFSEVGPKVGRKAYSIITRLQSVAQNQMVMVINTLDTHSKNEFEELMKDYANNHM